MINCLYVDDEPLLLEIAKEFLEMKEDLKVITNERPREVENILREDNIDVIVSDYQMSGMDGIELFEMVKKAGYNIPFVLFTGKGREEVAIRALNAGIDFYLVKGGSPAAQFAELENVIRQLARRREAEDALSYNNRRFQQIIENVLDIVMIIDHEGTIKYASPSVGRSMGVLPEEVIGSNAFSLLHPDDRPLLSMFGSSDLSALGDRTYELRLRIRGGEYKWFEGIAKPMPVEFGKDLIVLDAWEIDDRKRMELEVRNSERTLRAVFDNSTELMLITSLDGIVKAANRMLCESSGYSEDELLGSQVFDLVAPSSLELAKAQLASKVRSTGEKTTYRLAMRDRQGNERSVMISSQRVDNPGEEPFIIVTGLEDRALDESYDEMLRTKEYMELVIEEVRNIIIGLDRDGKVNVFNKRAAEFFGMPVSLVIGKDLRELIRGDVRYADALKDVLTGLERYVGEGVMDEQPYLMGIVDSTGDPRKVLWKGKKIMKGNYYHGMVMSGMDVTDLG